MRGDMGYSPEKVSMDEIQKPTLLLGDIVIVFDEENGYVQTRVIEASLFNNEWQYQSIWESALAYEENEVPSVQVMKTFLFEQKDLTCLGFKPLNKDFPTVTTNRDTIYYADNPK